MHAGILQCLSLSYDCFTVDGDVSSSIRTFSIHIYLEQECMFLLDILCSVRRGSVHGFCLQKRFEIRVGHDSIFCEPEVKRTGASYYEKDPVDETMEPLVLWPAVH